MKVDRAAERSDGPIQILRADRGLDRQRVAITKAMDSASMALWHESLYGEGLTIQIDFVKADAPYLTYTLLNAGISVMRKES